jgi:hypothetical protein
MENTYWNGNGKFQAAYDELVNLMPASGKADTVAGELIRATSRIGYQFYNNGMGNNVSGALNFLREKGAIDEDTYDTIYEYSRGRVYNGNYDGDSLQVAVERATDMTLEMITRNPVLLTMSNSEDIFDFEEEELYYEDEDDYYDEEEDEYAR